MSLMCSCEDSELEIVRDRIVTARKQHECEECDKPIKIGDEFRFMNIFNMYECRPVKPGKQCIRCAGVAMSLEEQGMCYYQGGLWEAHEEYLEMHEIILEERKQKAAMKFLCKDCYYEMDLLESEKATYSHERWPKTNDLICPECYSKNIQPINILQR